MLASLFLLTWLSAAHASETVNENLQSQDEARQVLDMLSGYRELMQSMLSAADSSMKTVVQEHLEKVDLSIAMIRAENQPASEAELNALKQGVAELGEALARIERLEQEQDAAFQRYTSAVASGESLEASAELERISVALQRVRSRQNYFSVVSPGPPSESPPVEQRIVVRNNAGEKLELAASASFPYPMVSLNDVAATEVSLRDGSAVISITGQVTDPLADIVAEGLADIRRVTIQYGVAESPGQVEFRSVSAVVTRDPGAQSSRLRPYPFSGQFRAEVSVPVQQGGSLVTVKAVNAIGNAGYDSFSVDYAVSMSNDPEPDPAVRVLVENHPSSDIGFVNPLFVQVSHEAGEKPESLRVNGAGIPLLEEGENTASLDRPIMAVFGSKTLLAPNIIDIRSSPALTLGDDSENGKQLSWATTRHSDPNYYKYAAGTEVYHKIRDASFRQWNVVSAEVQRVTGIKPNQEYTWGRDMASLATVAGKDPKLGEDSIVVKVKLGAESSGPRRLMLTLQRGDQRMRHPFGQFRAIPRLKTVIVAVDGLAYEAVAEILAKGKVQRGFRAFRLAFSGAANADRPALSALPTVTFANWPGVFGGAPPRDHGVIGNAFFPRELHATLPFASSDTRLGHLYNFGATLGALNDYARKDRQVYSLYDRLAGCGVRTAVSLNAFYSTANHVNVRRTTFPSARAGQLAFRPDMPIWSPFFDNVSEELLLLKEHNASAATRLDKVTGDYAQEFLESDPSRDIWALYFPGPDNIAHAVGAHSTPEVDPMDRYRPGPYVGMVDQPLYAIRDHVEFSTEDQFQRFFETLEGSGYLYATVFALVADHGLHAYHNTEHFNIGLEYGMDELFSSIGFRVWRAIEIDIGSLDASNFPDFETLLGISIRSPAEILMRKLRAELARSTLVFSANGGMAQIYVRSPPKGWRELPNADDIEAAARLLFIEATGGAATHPDTGQTVQYPPEYQRIYPDLAPKLNPAYAGGMDHGAFGTPPAIFVRIGSTVYKWVKFAPASGGVELGEIAEFIAASAAAKRWPEFEERLEEMNDRSAFGSRSGDVLVFADGGAGYLAVNDGDGYNGWHGGATESESYVPLMFNIPGNVVTEQFIVNAIPVNRSLRNWHLAEMLERIYASLYGNPHTLSCN